MQKGLFSIVIFILLMPAIFTFLHSSFPKSNADAQASLMQLASLRRAEFENNTALIIKHILSAYKTENSFDAFRKSAEIPIPIPENIDTTNELVRYAIAFHICNLMIFLNQNFDTEVYFEGVNKKEILDAIQCANYLFNYITVKESKCISVTIAINDVAPSAIVAKFPIPQKNPKFFQISKIPFNYTLEVC